MEEDESNEVLDTVVDEGALDGIAPVEELFGFVNQVFDDVVGTAALLGVGDDVAGARMFEEEADADGNALIELKLDDAVDEEQVSSLRIELESSVIDPPRANAPPWSSAPVFIVIDSVARIFPIKSVSTSIVALDPTFQKTLPGNPPPVISTIDPTEVPKELPI
jgi:hypothetical protein